MENQEDAVKSHALRGSREKVLGRSTGGCYYTDPGTHAPTSSPGLLTKREDGVPAIQVPLPEGQQGTSPLGEERGKERVVEHEPDRSDEGLGVLGDGAFQAANTFLKEDVGNSWRCMGAIIRGEYSLPLTHATWPLSPPEYLPKQRSRIGEQCQAHGPPRRSLPAAVSVES